MPSTMAPKVAFFTHGLCPYAQRVALALAWKGIEHECTEIDLSNKPSWYAKRLGTGLVPAIEIDGEPVAESLDIVRLLDDRFPGVPLVPAGRADDVEALVSFGNQLQSAGWSLLGGAWNFPTRGTSSERGRRAWAAAVDVISASLSKHGGPFLVGPAPSIADCALAPFVARFELAATRCAGFEARRENAALKSYLEALEADEGWRSTYPNRDDFGSAIGRFGSLDYFDFHTASLVQPMPR